MHATSFTQHSPSFISPTVPTAFNTSALTGTGSIFDINNIKSWLPFIQNWLPVLIEVEEQFLDNRLERLDVRTTAEHLNNIRQVFNPTIADLASALRISRQSIYKWISNEASPEQDKLEKILALSHAADSFLNAKITRASALLKMKIFKGRSLLELAAADQLLPKHIEILIREAQAMDSAYDRSKIARTKAKPTNDWQTEVSIPGALE